MTRRRKVKLFLSFVGGVFILSVVEVSFVGVSYGTVVGWVGVFICFCFAFPTFTCFGSILSLANRYFPL